MDQPENSPMFTLFGQSLQDEPNEADNLSYNMLENLFGDDDLLPNVFAGLDQLEFDLGIMDDYTESTKDQPTSSRSASNALPANQHRPKKQSETFTGLEDTNMMLITVPENLQTSSEFDEIQAISVPEPLIQKINKVAAGHDGVYFPFPEASSSDRIRTVVRPPLHVIQELVAESPPSTSKRKQTFNFPREDGVAFYDDGPESSRESKPKILPDDDDAFKWSGDSTSGKFLEPIDESQRCQGCQKVFKNLAKHKCRKLNPTQEVDQKLMECSCGKSFKTKKGWKDHMKRCVTWETDDSIEVDDDDGDFDAAPQPDNIDEVEEVVPTTPSRSESGSQSLLVSPTDGSSSESRPSSAKKFAHRPTIFYKASPRNPKPVVEPVVPSKVELAVPSEVGTSGGTQAKKLRRRRDSIFQPMTPETKKLLETPDDEFPPQPELKASAKRNNSDELDDMKPQKKVFIVSTPSSRPGILRTPSKYEGFEKFKPSGLKIRSRVKFSKQKSFTDSEVTPIKPITKKRVTFSDSKIKLDSPMTLRPRSQFRSLSYLPKTQKRQTLAFKSMEDLSIIATSAPQPIGKKILRSRSLSTCLTKSEIVLNSPKSASIQQQTFDVEITPVPDSVIVYENCAEPVIGMENLKISPPQKKAPKRRMTIFVESSEPKKAKTEEPALKFKFSPLKMKTRFGGKSKLRSSKIKVEEKAKKSIFVYTAP